MKTSLFCADRKSGILLEIQFADWLKGEISRGRFPADAPLPGIVELARSCRVSTTTVRSALRQLAVEGWVRPVRHVGSVVLRMRTADIKRKRVLLWECGTFFCYYSDQFFSALRTALLCGKESATIAVANGVLGRNPYIQLTEQLRESWDIVISHGNNLEANRMIEAAGHPFVIVGNGERVNHSVAENCKGVVEVLSSLALQEFARKCVKKRVRTVFQVLCQKGAYDANDILSREGITVRTFHTPHLSTPEAVTRAGFEVVHSWFGRDCPKLPDLVLFTDDYIAQGGLMALKMHGVRIPEDVAVVSHANKGHGPVWEKPLSRMEMNPISHAAVVAKAVRAFLKGRPFPEGIVLGSVWKNGQTF